jgi:glycosyltransferase involved in cell wall biosynthesis
MTHPVIIIVMVAYNAERTVQKTVEDVPDGVGEIVFVDDASRDRTVHVAQRLNLTVFVHPENRGYGAAQKTGYAEALRRNADVVILLHADYQYDPRKIPELIRPILEKRADFVLGSRMMNGGALKGGMPFWRYCANRFLTVLANIVFGLHLTEYHSGFRAYNAQVLQSFDFECKSNDYIFDAEVIAYAVLNNWRIAEIPIETRYFKEASSITFWHSVRYGFGVLKILSRYPFMKKLRRTQDPYEGS